MRRSGDQDASRATAARCPSPDLDPARLASLFDAAAASYDRVNTVITFGLDGLWRRWAARQALASSTARLVRPSARGGRANPRVLDACAGTGALALALASRGAAVTAVDAAPGALALARRRLAAKGLPARVVVADLAGPTDLRDAVGPPFDAVTLGFGLRYFAAPGALLARLRTLLKPGGRLVLLEAVRPPQDLAGRAAAAYLFHVAPRLGATLAGRAELYDLLAASTRALGSSAAIETGLRAAGFRVIARRRFAAGAVVGFVAEPAEAAGSSEPAEPSASAASPPQ